MFISNHEPLENRSSHWITSMKNCFLELDMNPQCHSMPHLYCQWLGDAFACRQPTVNHVFITTWIRIPKPCDNTQDGFALLLEVIDWSLLDYFFVPHRFSRSMINTIQSLLIALEHRSYHIACYGYEWWGSTNLCDRCLKRGVSIIPCYFPYPRGHLPGIGGFTCLW